MIKVLKENLLRVIPRNGGELNLERNVTYIFNIGEIKQDKEIRPEIAYIKFMQMRSYNMVSICRHLSLYLLILFFIPVDNCLAQTEDFIAIIPSFHCRQGMARTESPIQLVHQRFVAFVYSNAVAVYSEADFVNQTENIVDQEVGLPSTGHDENGDEPGGRISNGILSVQLWIDDENANPELIRDGNEDWYLVKAQFAPHQNRRIKALFWAETSLADVDSLPGLDTSLIVNGNRGFLIDLAHASMWGGDIQLVDVYVIFQDSIRLDDQTFSAAPLSYNLEDSTLTWLMDNIEPSAGDNIEVKYESPSITDSSENTMKKLSAFIVKKVYDQLIDYGNQLDE